MDRIKRVKRDSWTTISSAIARDKRASLKARGLLLTVMSLPETWEFTVEGLITILKEGRDAVYAVINELVNLGYCTRTRVRSKGKFVRSVYTFDDDPTSPHPEKPDMVKPDTEKPTQYNKQEYNKNKIPTTHKHPQTYVRVGDEYIGNNSGDFFQDLDVHGPREYKEQPFLIDMEVPEKKRQLAPIPDTAHRLMYRLCYLAETVDQATFLDSRQRGRVASVLGKLRDVDADLNNLTLFESWWKGFWMSKNRESGQYQPPKPEQVQEYWLVAMNTMIPKTEISTNGTQPHQSKPGPTMEELERVMRRNTGE